LANVEYGLSRNQTLLEKMFSGPKDIAEVNAKLALIYDSI
jgi:hypothetical protein